MKKACLLFSVFFFIAFLTGISPLIQGIALRGPGGVNYGRILFPLLLSGIFLCLFRRQH